MENKVSVGNKHLKEVIETMDHTLNPQGFGLKSGGLGEPITMSLDLLKQELSRHESGLSADQTRYVADLVELRNALQARKLKSGLPLRMRFLLWLLTPLAPPSLEVESPLHEAAKRGLKVKL